MSFKILHQFKISVDQEVKESLTRTENGKEIVETSTSIKPVLVNIVLKEPTRREKYDVGLWQSIKQNEGLNLGLMLRVSMIQKLAKDPNSPISGDDDKSLVAMNARLQELANDYIRLNTQSTPETDEQKARKEQLSLEYMVLQKKVIDINTAYQSVFAHTAEQYAQNKVLTWLTLFLSYIKVGPDKYEPLFPGATFEAKEEKLGELEDAQDKIYFAAVEKLSSYWMFYYFGRATKAEDFAKIEEEMAKQFDAEKKIREEAEAKEKADSEKPVAVEPIPVASVEAAPTS